MPDRADVGPGHSPSGPVDPPAVPATPPPPLRPVVQDRPPMPDAPDAGYRSPRPVFVDPPAPFDPPPRAAAPPVLQPESVYEQTVLPSLGESPKPASEAAGAGRERPWLRSPLFIGGMASAALVVVAALLLALGVL